MSLTVRDIEIQKVRIYHFKRVVKIIDIKQVMPPVVFAFEWFEAFRRIEGSTAYKFSER